MPTVVRLLPTGLLIVQRTFSAASERNAHGLQPKKNLQGILFLRATTTIRNC